ncbi:PREDICTED: cytochrome P450 76A1-like [Prunus mume]|uniref:Cytochrome P450 76A1-like n=1 Tax=Prunus mume TaxID=102107 RepID=A0ABM1LY61_PRUMU|nr:PREDICTED: cytochrome P450 76A1-like [Prunus mume]
MARKTLKQQEYVFSSHTITEAIRVHGLLKQLYLSFDDEKFSEHCRVGLRGLRQHLFKPFDPRGLKQRILKIFWRLYAFYENIIKERLEERKIRIGNIGKEKLDLLDVLLDYRSDRYDELKSLSRKNIKGMLATLFKYTLNVERDSKFESPMLKFSKHTQNITCTETTSSTFEWGMAEIQRKPDAYKKIVMELDQVVGKVRFVEESDISNLPYLQAAVKEVFWLHPAVPLLVPHGTNEVCEISSYHIPKGCIVLVNVLGMARDPSVWEDPCEFKTVRFLGSSIDVKGHDFNLIPFGSGKRSCIGLPLVHRMGQPCFMLLNGNSPLTFWTL